MQQFKRAKELASGTPEAEKMRKAAALKKRVQRMREKECSGRNVTRGAERGNENEGENCCLFQHQEKISIIFIIISFLIIMFIMSNQYQVAKR